MAETTPLISTGAFKLASSPRLWRAGSVFVAIGMMAGAFGAHGLRKKGGVTVDNLRAWETASTYATCNGLALMLIAMHPSFSAHKFAGPAIAAGGAVFSCTIFALVLARDKLRFLGPITPLGGTVMIAGYIALAF